jgi:hypothetical protein
MLVLTALSHIVFGYVAFASAGLLALSGDRPRRLARYLFIVVPALAAIAWFVIPLYLSRHEISHNRWEGAYKWDSFGAPVILRALANGTLLDFGRWPLLTLLIGAGTLSALWQFRDPLARRLLLLAGFWLMLFFGRDTWGHLLALAGIPADFHLHRLQAAFELFAIYLGAWGIEAAITRVPMRLVAGALTVAVALLCIPMGYERAAFLEQNRKWGDDNLAAWHRERPDWEAALTDIRAILAKRPGRVSAGLSNGWGRSFSVGSVPTFALLSLAQLDEPSMLYHSMSLPSEAMGLRNDDDPAEAAAYGVRVLVMPADRTAPGWLQKRGVHGRFAVYEASPEGYFGIVDPVARFLGAPPTRYELNQAWLKGPLSRSGQVVLFDERGPELPRLRRWDPLPAPAGLPPAGDVLSESQSGESHRAQLRMSRPAWALIKITWFPDLHATVDGREQPLLRATPELGVVAVPAGEHVVEVFYRPGPLKPILFLLGVIVFALFAIRKFDESWLAAQIDRIAIPPSLVSALAVAALIVVALHPLFRGRLMDGHDATGYPPRLPEMAEALRDHQLIWAPDLSAGHGQPLFEFAPPLVYLAAMPFLSLGIADAYQFGLALLFSLGALALWRLAARLGASREVRFCVVAAWLFAPYLDLDLFVRAAFAEAAAVAVAPIALAGIMAALDEPNARRVLFGAMAVMLIPLAHDGAALLLLPALALFVAGRAYTSKQRARSVIAGGLVLAGGLALSAFFWLPAFVEKDFTKVHLLKEEALRWSDHAIEPWQLFTLSWGYGTSNPGPDDGMSFQLGWAHLALAMSGAWLAWRSRDPSRRALALSGSALALFYAFLSTRWSSPIWSHLETLQYLAYPWRALMVPALFLPLLALGAFERLPLRWAFVACAALMVLNLPHTEPQQYLVYDEEFYAPERIAKNNLNISMREEYEPT